MQDKPRRGRILTESSAVSQAQLRSTGPSIVTMQDNALASIARRDSIDPAVTKKLKKQKEARAPRLSASCAKDEHTNCYVRTCICTACDH